MCVKDGVRALQEDCHEKGVKRMGGFKRGVEENGGKNLHFSSQTSVHAIDWEVRAGSDRSSCLWSFKNSIIKAYIVNNDYLQLLWITF